MQKRLEKEHSKEMPDHLDKVIDEIQASIIEDARKVYSEKVIERWLHPEYMGEIENPQGYGKITGPCGDTVRIFLRIINGRIIDARFTTNGCATTLAAGCMACELAIGKTLREAYGITKEMILEQLDGLPEESTHCAVLASNTLREALTDYLTSKNETWKRLYKNRQRV
ncbi:MAG TPA: iron-sulfur cluster assembly scaffold protein [Desulfatiglandales bacterium]|nr:iron-sulfur cluster assembly scaffold protein [Desulfatiglandales bacterium]